jgi:hypothetical protein
MIVYMLVCECLCVWVPAKFAELWLDPLIILCVGVDQGDEKDILSPHIQKVSPHLFNCILVLQMFPLFYQNFIPPLMESESPTKYSKPIAKQNISDQLGFNVKITIHLYN